MKLLLIVAVDLLWFISLLHINWAFGGRWGSAAAIPVKEGEQKPAFTPKKWGTLFVAILILLAGVIIVVQGGYLQGFQANGLSKLGSIVCTFVFIIRAIGDFKYVGFFKKIKHSQFARYDTWLYSPLCLFFGIVYIIQI
ncbi:membrane protein [Lysinibacillus sphaericus]|uniref:DUF3995 domain-containing protein n=1 Tax=Lysinibacillus sphaericus TaxID=1421 RepID=UPI0018CD2C60|nr:DUF3995 domain-containing protein [Lysinibacillus sphaericus]MBG9456230.1 membrane protein [Lysinibacillus sphaericus]MBG9479226.1 membrane protein [Lysinibacillus sphaericus]MBG9591476.1 membrane protein [Lysinibacillus sphaericus]